MLTPACRLCRLARHVMSNSEVIELQALLAIHGDPSSADEWAVVANQLSTGRVARDVEQLAVDNHLVIAFGKCVFPPGSKHADSGSAELQASVDMGSNESNAGGVDSGSAGLKHAVATVSNESNAGAVDSGSPELQTPVDTGSNESTAGAVDSGLAGLKHAVATVSNETTAGAVDSVSTELKPPVD